MLLVGAGLWSAGGVSACHPTERGAAPPDGGAPIRIGVTLALTGDLGSSGSSTQQAIRVAERQLNAFGGVLGRRIEFIVVDDASDSTQRIVDQTIKLIDDGAIAIIGPIGSGQVSAVQKATFDRQIIQISGSSTSPELTSIQPARDRFFFRTVPHDLLQARAMALFVLRGPGDLPADAGPVDSGPTDAATDAPVPDAAPVDSGPPNRGCRRLGIVHNDDAYGRPFADALAQEVRARGGAVVQQLAVPTELKADYKTEVAALQTDAVECVALITYDPAATEFVRDWRAAVRDDPTKEVPGFFFVGGDGVFASDFIVNGRQDKADPNSPTIVEGVYGTIADPNPESSQYADFRNVFLSEFELEPGQTDLSASVAAFYDAAILVGLAIERAGSTTDRVKLRDALFDVSRPGSGQRSYGPGEIGEALAALRKGGDIDYVGASGPVDFDDNGDVVSNFVIWKVQNGAFATVERVRFEELQ